MSQEERDLLVVETMYKLLLMDADERCKVFGMAHPISIFKTYTLTHIKNHVLDKDGKELVDARNNLMDLFDWMQRRYLNAQIHDPCVIHAVEFAIKCIDTLSMASMDVEELDDDWLKNVMAVVRLNGEGGRNE